ncbi:MAG: asparagine synthase (glutamine-hydrolyzing) [Candidatus Aminicenantes bacterium]|nr:asparagine synthase (glutamine-hydrolyzing) [Candidatus Aminicenantes bacterium]
MCGICGFITKPGEPPSAEVLRGMLRTIVHRGPDDEGVYLGPRTALGVRRLSIIDLETGHQPLSNEDGSVWIAYNGETYNFSELKNELQAKGHAFATRTDTETIVHAYEQWGEGCLERLRGMFAFGLWDGRKEQLLLARDRVGKKPLYYTLLDDGSLVFGSELKCLAAHPRVVRELNPQALDLFLTLEYIPAPLSIYKNIFKLPAGHYLIHRQGRVAIRPYWDIEPRNAEAAEAQPISVAAACDRLFELLKESVRLRLISDVPLGALLSGGIDSSCIVGLMRELGASPLKTFSIGFEDASYNELKFARKTARAFGTDHEELVLRPRALELTEKLVRHLDEPLGDFSIFPTFLVSQMARAQVKVVLSGDGGDEIFGGYEHYQAQKLGRLPGAALVGRAASALTRALPPSAKKKGAWNKARRYSQGLALDPASRHLRWMTFLTAKERTRLYSPALIEALAGIREARERDPFRSVFAKMPGFDPITAELYLDFKTYLPDDIMVKVDRMSMAVSLEARAPLLDQKVVEFAFGLPGSWKLHGLTTKWIFKKTMERLLPRDNITRRKEGFSIPIKHWLQVELRDMLLDHLSESRIKREGFFNYGPIRRMLDGHLHGRENYSHQLWALLVFEIWMENYL